MKTSANLELLANEDVTGKRPVFVGRKRAILEIRYRAERAFESGGGLVLVRGGAGMGKTAFVRAAFGAAGQRRWCFLEGKSEMGSLRPQTALECSLRRYAQRELEDNLGRERGRRLLRILDEEKEGTTRQPLARVFLDIARQEGGLVLFVDDLQWMDAASVEACALMAALGESPVFIVAAYREGEVEWGDDPYKRLVRFRGQEAELEIPITPFSEAEVREYIEKSLPGIPVPQLGQLAGFLYGRSGGVPQYTQEAIAELRLTGELRFLAEEGRWDFSGKPSWGSSANPDIVGLIARRMARLDRKSRAALGRLACFPGPVSEDAIRFGLVEEERRALPELMGCGYLIQEPVGNSLAFSHDNVKEAARGLFGPEEAAASALEIARRLQRARLSETWGYDLCELYLKAPMEDLPPSERIECARLCLSAARAAEASRSFQSALRYAQGALDFLPKNEWEPHHPLVLGIHQCILRVSCPARRPDIAAQIAKATMALARGRMEALPARETEAALLMGEHRLVDSVNLYREIVGDLGFRIYGPEASARTAIRRVSNQIRIELARRNLPARRRPLDEATGAALRLLISSYAATYLSMPAECRNVMNLAVGLSLGADPNPLSSIVLMCYAQTECAQGRYRQAKKAADLALRWTREREGLNLPPFQFLWKFFVAHYWEPVRSGMDDLRSCYKTALDMGNYEYACITAVVLAYDLMFYGGPLPNVLREMESFLAVSEALRQERSRIGMLKHIQFACALMDTDKGAHDTALSGVYFSKAKDMGLLEKASDVVAIATLAYYDLFYLYLTGRMEALEAAARELEERLPIIQSQSFEGQAVFYLGLAYVRMARSRLPNGRASFLKRAGRCRARLNHAARSESSSYRYLALALGAELRTMPSGALKAESKTERMYLRALEGACRAGCLADQGTIAELLADFYGRRGDDFLERATRGESYLRFREWGARIKTKSMEARWPWLRGALSEEEGFPKGEPEEAALIRLAASAPLTADPPVLIRNLLSAILGLTRADRILLVREADGSFFAAAECERLEKGPCLVRLSSDESIAFPGTFDLARLLDDSMGLGFDEIRKVLRLAESEPSVEREGSGITRFLPLDYGEARAGFLALEYRRDAPPPMDARVRMAVGFALQASAILEQSLITKRRAVLAREREELLRGERLTALGVLGASLGHEVRAPVHAIRMNAAFLRSRLAKHDQGGEKELLDALRDIDESAAHVSQIASELAGFARDRGNIEVLSLNEVVESALRLARDFIRRSGARLELDLQAGDAHISGSASRLKQLVIIFLENACQAMPKAGGRVLVSTAFSEGAIELRVEDTGSGISADDLPRITEAFFTTRPESGGAGLGLAIAKGIVRELGGQLEIASELDKGTRVTVSLPRTDPGV